MAGPYSRFGNDSQDYFRQLITGGDIEVQPEESPGIMSRPRFAGSRPPVANDTPPEQPEEPNTSFFENFARMLGRSSDEPERVADAVLRDAQPVRPTGGLDGWENLPSVDTIIAPRPDQTRAALGEADVLTNVEDEITSTNANFAMLKIGEESTPITSATHLTNMFDALGEVEGYYAHVDGRGIFTMPYGVVPDDGSVTGPDGTAFDPRGRRGSHGFTTSTAATVNTSNATHTVNGNTVKRSDYDSDESFARAVVSLYNIEAAKTYGEGWDNLSDDARSMALDMAWNGGVNSLGWSTVRPSLAETSKENPDTAVLFGFTQNMRSGINYPRGLFKRRLIQYNRIANPEDVASTYSTESLMRNGQRVGTRYIAHRADGTNIGSWDRYDVADDPSTPQNERRVASNEIIAANVGLD
jgi:hypothetical protein